MTTMESLIHLIGEKAFNLNSLERKILEAELFSQICKELKEYFRKVYEEYFKIMKLTKEMEIDMLEENFTKLIIKDILQSEEYTVEGLARYTNFPEDVIHEVMCGLNKNPSALLLQKAIDLHRLVRRDLYQAIINKVISQEHIEE